MFGLSLHAAEGDAFHKLLLQNDIEQEGEDEGERCAGHDQAVVGIVHAAEGGHGNRQREHGAAGGNDQRPEEVVPRGGEGEHRQRDERGLGQRQDDREEGAEFAAAVNFSCFDQLVGHALHELTHQEDAERTDHGQNQRCIGVGQVELVDHDEHGNQRYLTGYHHGGQIDLENGLAAGHGLLFKAVGRHGGHDIHQQAGAGDDDDAVFQRGAEIALDDRMNKPKEIVKSLQEYHSEIK